MLNIFQSGQCHLALVSKDPEESLRCLRSGQRCGVSATILGIVTLEDIIERIIQNDIRDETDQCTPSHAVKMSNVISRGVARGHSRKKLSSCPDLLNSPVLYDRKRSGSSVSGKQRFSEWPSHRLQQHISVGLPFDDDQNDHEADGSVHAYSYQNSCATDRLKPHLKQADKNNIKIVMNPSNLFEKLELEMISSQI
jgi:hypothetical protein